MKKYLITEEQRFLIVEGMHPDYQAVASEIYALNPIEPLSDREISKLWSDAHNDTSDRMAHQVLSRAIERRIIGDTP